MALAKARQYQCYLTHLNYHQNRKWKSRKKKNKKNKEEHIRGTFLLIAETVKERRRLHRCHFQHKSLL